MKEQKGITLIALIITIIVMLILVGVTINVALNGGLFDKAKNAKEQTQKQVDIEILQAAVVGAYNEITGKIDYTELNSEVIKLGFTGENGIYSKNGKIYEVDSESAKVTEVDENTVVGTYKIYGSGKENESIELKSNGQYKITDERGIMDGGEGTYKYNENTSKVTISPTGYTEEYEFTYYTSGNNKVLIPDDPTEYVLYTSNSSEGLIIDTDKDITYTGSLGRI